MSRDIPLFRRLGLPAAVVLAIGAPALQATLDLGLSQARFAADGNSTLRAAGYAFSIWSMIYAGLGVYAVYQARPKAKDTEVLSALAWPSLVAILGCAAWIVASAKDWKWASVAIILTSASALAVGLGRAAKARPRGAERWLAIWPLGLLGGWLAIASAINILTVLTAKGLIGPETALPAALVGIVVVAVIGVAFTLRTRITASAVPIAWGLAGVYVAERSGNPVAAWSALGASVVVGLAAVAAGRRNFRVR